MTTRLPFSENEIEETIVGRWKRIVERFDQKIAVSTFSGETFTYADLDLASDQIAAHLIAELGEENLPVLLLFEHSYQLIVAIMGALKANKAYVALDPNQPAKQLKLLADCAQANLLVAKPDLLQLAERVTNGRIVSFDDISHLDEPVEPIKGSADDIAGIFFTSGTISNPKGVPRSHRTIMHRVWFATDLAGFKPGDHISGLRQCGLGGGVADLFSALLNGATYCLYDIRKIGLIPLSDWLLLQKISYFHPPIVAFRQWLDMQDETTFFPELRFILPSGRKRVEDLGRLWPHVSDECVVLTSYSSTETTQMCCSIIDKSTHLTSDILDVGRPLPGKEILILDADGNGVAAGVEGEIVVRSRFISREYWRRPELSSEKFLVLDDGVTIQYRSGDFGTLQADGQLAITGRKDSQIKLRGYRVMLDEVENALARLPEIKEAAVLADFHRDRLNAYLVSGNPAPTQAAIRAQLAQTIPDYSLPATYTFLQAFPTLPSGKIDKHNLPQPDETRPRISADYVPPVKPDEKLLVAIWESVLGIKGIGLDDNFFELGGHSLLATEVVFKLVEELGIELPVYQLFAHSTVRQLAEIVRTKQVQIEQKIEAIERNQPLPLSYGEERLWFIHHLETDSAQYTTSRGFRIRGDVDADVLAESLELLSQRQEALRTTFKVMDGKPYRLISAEKQYSFQLTDVRSHDVQTREAKVREHMKQVGRTRFDLENGPLFRFQLIQLKDEEFVFIFSAHHIVTDAWSSSLFWQELGPIYAAVLEGIDSELPEMSIQYADFASWQRERQNSILDRQLAYWKAQFENVPPLLELPLDFPRSNRQHTRGRSVYKPIPVELSEKLSKLSNELQATTFMTYFAVLNLLLYRYSGQETIVVGTPIAGRTSSQTQNILGFFPNTLAIPTKINGAQAFEAFFAGCKQQLIDAFENQELPFEKLVNELAVDRSLNHHPLFQVMFMMLDITPDNFPFYDFDITVEPKERENIIFDVRIVVEQDGDLETIRWDYNDAIFREQTISQLGDHFIALLEQVANQINRPVGRLPLLSPLERQLAVETYGAGTTRIKPDSYQSIPAVFEAQASKTPNIPALLYGDERLSYRDLNRQANLLAHTLMQRGVKTGTRIGIKISRSINQVVGLLGIMKVGGVYVPLVGDLPAERQSAILEDADVQLILTDDGTGQLEIDSLSIDKVMEEGEMHSGWEKNPTVSLSPDSEAYVLYTSGSTGWPKGVVGLHKGVLNRINWLNHTYPFEGDEVVAGKTSLGFVDSVAEIFGTLCLGGTLAMIPDKFVRDPDALVGQLAKHAVTRMIVVPSLLRVMLESNASLEEKLPKLKMWFCGGEELTEKLIVYFYQRLPNRLLVNIYGSSEVSADATWYEVPFQTEEAGLKIPIGRPLDNVQVFILDEHLQPVPTGVAGTIYVAGDGLARGYTDPKIEKGAFSPNIFGDRMMYCMGDIGRFRFVADSEQPVIEFIGRVDSQIKIRGMRVEISEIEAVLEAHPAVNQAVMDWAEQNGEHVLSAYIVLETELSAAECKAHLARKLPSHMIPAQFIEVEEIAFNNSGKVDRLKLRELAQNRTTLLNKLEIVPPRNRMEEKLLEIWLGLLPQENISVEDRFFEIGGHSLLAVRLFAEIEQEFRVKLPVATIFEHGSIEALGKLLEPPETQIGKGINLLVPLQPKGSLPALFLIHARDGFVLKYQQLVDELGDEQQIYGLRSQGIDGDSEPLQSIEEMATQYIAEIKRVQPEGPYHLAGWSLGGWLAFEMAQQLLAAGDALGTLAILDTRAHRHPKYKDVRPAIQQAFQRKARHARLAHHTQKLKEQNFFGSLRYLVQLTQRMFSRTEKPHREFKWVGEIPDYVQAVWDTNRNALKQYQPKLFDADILLIRSIEDGEGAYYGWEELIKGVAKVEDVPGNHTTILEPPSVQTLAKVLKAAVSADSD